MARRLTGQTIDIEWAYNGHPVAGFDVLLDRYPYKEFKSPARSTIPLLAFWRSPEPRIRELCNALDVAVPATVHLDFEHLVHPPRGRGRPSHTDLMVRSKGLAVAIEAKWTEPRYETVGSWLSGSSNPSNRREVLRGWFELMERRGAEPILTHDVLELPYQMIHRTASACSVDEASRRWMVYQVFDPSAEARSGYLADLAGIRRLASGSCLQIALAECKIERSPILVELRERWAAGERDLRAHALESLRRGELLSVRLDRVSRSAS